MVDGNGTKTSHIIVTTIGGILLEILYFVRIPREDIVRKSPRKLLARTNNEEIAKTCPHNILMRRTCPRYVLAK